MSRLVTWLIALGYGGMFVWHVAYLMSPSVPPRWQSGLMIFNVAIWGLTHWVDAEWSRARKAE